MLSELPDLAGGRHASSEAGLEAIQMAWYEEWKDNR